MNLITFKTEFGQINTLEKSEKFSLRNKVDLKNIISKLKKN